MQDQDKTDIIVIALRDELKKQLAQLRDEIDVMIGEATSELVDLVDGRMNGIEQDVVELKQGQADIKDIVEDIPAKMDGAIDRIKWGKDILEYNLKTGRIKLRPVPNN